MSLREDIWMCVKREEEIAFFAVRSARSLSSTLECPSIQNNLML